jgi:hypothetical protein
MKKNNYRLYLAALLVVAALVSIYFHFDDGATVLAFGGVLMSAFGQRFFKNKKDNS